MSVKRRKYAPSEKAKIALAAIKGELTMAQIITKYAVHATQVKQWKKKALSPLAFFIMLQKNQHKSSEATSVFEQFYSLAA